MSLADRGSIPDSGEKGAHRGREKTENQVKFRPYQVRYIVLNIDKGEYPKTLEIYKKSNLEQYPVFKFNLIQNTRFYTINTVEIPSKASKSVKVRRNGVLLEDNNLSDLVELVEGTENISHFSVLPQLITPGDPFCEVFIENNSEKNLIIEQNSLIASSELLKNEINNEKNLQEVFNHLFNESEEPKTTTKGFKINNIKIENAKYLRDIPRKL